MIRHLSLGIFLLFLPCLCRAVEVTQDKKLLLVQMGQSVDIKCHQNDNTYFNMYWYQQKQGEGLKLMVWSQDANKEQTMEDDYKVRWSLERPDIMNSVLKLIEAKDEDNAVYFCAASRQGGNSAAYFGEGTILSVLEPGRNETPPKLSIFPPVLLEVQKNGHALIACVARDFYPEHIHMYWMVNNELRKESSQSEVLENAGTLTMSSLLRVSKEEYFNPNNNFQCRAGFRGREKENNIAINIKGEIGCGISRESYKRYVNNGKFSYLLILFKSGLYGLIVVAVVIRKKAIRGSS